MYDRIEKLVMHGHVTINNHLNLTAVELAGQTLSQPSAFMAEADADCTTAGREQPLFELS